MFKGVVTTVLLVLSLVLFAAPVQAQRIITSPQATSSGLVTVDVVTTTSSAATVNLATVAGQIYGLVVDAGGNTAGTAVYVNFYNALSANVTPGTTAPMFSLLTAAGGSNAAPGINQPVPFGTPIGIPYSTALSANCTTTRATTAGGGATSTTSACHVTLVRR